MGPIDGHRLAAITTTTIVNRYPRVVGRNSHKGSHGAGPTSTAVAVHTDQGASGWGLATGALDGIDELIGRPINYLFEPENGMLSPAAMPLDYALHDLAGQLLGQPVHQILGGRGATSMPVYDGAIYLDDLDVEPGRELDVVLANCAADYEAGFRAFKLKIGRGFKWMEPEAGLARDIEVTRAVRAAYPDVEVLADANDGFSVADTLHYLDAVSDCRLFWLEEPFAENREDLELLHQFLRQRGLPTLIADGEADPDIKALLPLAAEGLLDVLLMDVISYGLTPWRYTMSGLVDAGVQSSPHAWGEPLKTLYAAQIGAGLGNVLTVEGVPGTVEDVDTGAYVFTDGQLQVPDLPGFGIPLPAALARR